MRTRSDSGKTFLSRKDAIRLFDSFEVLLFEEKEEQRELAHGGTQHWHLFDIISHARGVLQGIPRVW